MEEGGGLEMFSCSFVVFTCMYSEFWLIIHEGDWEGCRYNGRRLLVFSQN